MNESFIKNNSNDTSIVTEFFAYLANEIEIPHKYIGSLLPYGHRLIVPFFGAGEIFVNTKYQNYVLADTNIDLINCFRRLSNYGNFFIKECKKLFIKENNNLEIFNYYKDLFNITKEYEFDFKGGLHAATYFIYLNRHAKKPIEYDIKGNFNSSFGGFSNPYFPEKEMNNFKSKIDSSNSVIFEICGFKEILELATDGDVIYCDLPKINNDNILDIFKRTNNKFTNKDKEFIYHQCNKLKNTNKIHSIIINNNKVDVFSPYGYNMSIEQIHELDKHEIKRQIKLEEDRKNSNIYYLSDYREIK